MDLIKADDLVLYPDEIDGFANAIEQCGRDMILSLSPGGKSRPTDLPHFRRGNMLRVTADILGSPHGPRQSFHAWRAWQGNECRSFWIDLDIIPFGQLLLMSPPEYASKGGTGLAGYGTRRRSQRTQHQMRTFITQRALAASPLNSYHQVEGYADG